MFYFTLHDAVGHELHSPQPGQSFEPLKANADAASNSSVATDIMIFFITISQCFKIDITD
jgi:hypothetical protein